MQVESYKVHEQRGRIEYLCADGLVQGCRDGRKIFETLERQVFPFLNLARINVLSEYPSNLSNKKIFEITEKKSLT